VSKRNRRAGPPRARRIRPEEQEAVADSHGAGPGRMRGSGPQIEFVAAPPGTLAKDEAVLLLKDRHGNTVREERVPTHSLATVAASIANPEAFGYGRNTPVPVPLPEQCRPPAYTAADVPRLRDGVLEAWRAGLLERLLANHGGSLNFPYVPGTRKLWTVQEYCRFVIDRLDEADLFYVTDDMSQVVAQAGAAAPLYQVVQDQQPAEVGFVVWARPICTVTRDNAPDFPPGHVAWVNAALWAPVADCGMGEPGVLVVTFQDCDRMLANQFPGDASWPRALAQQRGDWGPLGYYDEAPLPWGTHPYGQEQQPMGNQPLAVVQSTWIMMSQRITVETKERPNRQQRKAYARAGRAEPVVRAVTLRRAAPDKQHREPGKGTRVYTRRWWVGDYGYWRNTWYASKQEHRQQFVVVPGYLKGPEGAPIVGGERVGVLRR
jgi:hypothetical protein